MSSDRLKRRLQRLGSAGPTGRGPVSSITVAEADPKTQSDHDTPRRATPAAEGASPSTAAALTSPADSPPLDDADRARRIAWLRDRLDRAARRGRSQLQADGAARRSPRPSLTDPVASAAARESLPGEDEDTTHGRLRRRREVFAAAHNHGRVEIGAALGCPGPTLAALALDDALLDVEPRTALFLDTETTGLAGGTGSLPFVIGLGGFTDDGASTGAPSLVLEQLVLPRPGDEGPMLAYVAERLATASCLVTYNGKSFDWPLLRNRFVMNRLPVPAVPRHLDLLHVARRLFARRLDEVSLVRVEEEILGLVRQGDIDGMMIPRLYFDYLRGAPGSTLTPVLEHNRLDLLALAALMAEATRLWTDPTAAVHTADQVSLARLAMRRKDVDKRRSFVDRALTGRRSDPHRGPALLMAAEHERRSGAPKRAAELLEEALDLLDEPERWRCHLRLAKLYEHALCDFDEALRHAARVGRAEDSEACAKRRARIERKRDAHGGLPKAPGETPPGG